MRWRVAGAAGAALVAVSSLTGAQAQAASAVYGASLTRAPYVTDVTQTSAEVNWATSNSTAAGSVQWVDESTGGTCPTSAWVWSTTTGQTANATTQIPYGAGSGTLGWGFSVNSVHEYQNSVQLTGLVAGHSYCYAVFSSKTSSATDLLVNPTYQSFSTLQPVSPSSAATVSFDVIGDTGENFAKTSSTVDTPFPGSPTSNPYQSKLYSEIGSDGSQFLLGAGDTSYNGGTQDTYGDLTQTGTAAQAAPNGTEYSNIFGPSYLPLARGLPTFLADGNHGQNNYGLRFFPTQTTSNVSGGAYAMDSYNVDGVSGSYPDDWFAFSTGNVRIYVLDAAWSDTHIGSASSMYQVDTDAHWQPGSAEYEWLQADLTNPANAGMVKMAVFHFPLQSDTNSEISDTYLQSTLEPLLAQNGVSIAFNGHAHTYQRFIPTGTNQIVSYVTGGGGGVPEPVNPAGNSMCKSLLATESVYAIGWSPTSNSGTSCGAPQPSDVGQVYSYLHVTVTGSTVQVSGVNADGQQFDNQTYRVNNVPPPTTTVFIPSAGATLSGTTYLDAGAANATTVEYLLTGGSYSDQVIGTATPTYYGWLFDWDSTTVPNGSYTVRTEAFNSTGSAFSPSVSFTVNNVPPPTTTVFIPSAGATLSGTTYLDAAAANATTVEYLLTGGSYSDQVIGTATPTYYGWLFDWDSTTVPNGSYTVRTEAFNSTGSAFSPSVSFTVNNVPPPTTTVFIPSAGATLSGTTYLDAAAANATTVEYLLTGGSYSDQVIGTATPTYYGWLFDWDSTTVPNGSYTVRTEAFNSTGSAFSPSVSFTVNN